MNASAQRSLWDKFKPRFSVFWRGALIITIPTLCLVASMLIIASLRSRTIEAREEEKQERQVLNLTQQVLQDVVDAQTGVRGYALTGQPEFLETYLEAQQKLPQSLEELETALGNDQEQMAEFQDLEPLVIRQMELLEETLVTVQQLDTPVAETPELTQQILRSNEAMEQLRVQLAMFIDEEQFLGQQRENNVTRWRDLTTNVQWLVLVISLMAATAAIYLFYLLDQELSERAERLRDSNLRLEAVFDSVVDGIITLDAQGYIQSCNQAAAQIFGYEIIQMPGLSLRSLVAAEHFASSRDALNYFLGTKGNKLYRFQETLGKRKSQDQFPMELAMSQLKSDQVSPLYIAILRDITQRKQSEETLRKQAQLLDLANDFIVVRDLNDRITYWNQGAERLLGWKASEAIGKCIHRLLQTKFPEPLEELQATYLAQGNWQGELVQVDQQGNRLVVSSSWTLQTDEEGQPLAHLEINKDITAAKQAELALRHREEMYRALVENFPNGAVFLYDFDLRYTLAAGTALRHLPQSTEAIVGKTLAAVTPENAALLEPLYRAALAGEQQTTEVRYGERMYRAHILPITQADGTVLVGMVMIQDITQSKQYEENLRSRAEELARTTGVLAHTTRILEKRNQELNQFAYIVSHDLKAPLRAIANLSSWIEEDLEDRLDEDTRHQMDLLRGRVHRMESLIEGLLQYSRIGRIEATVTTVNVKGLLQEIINSLDPPPHFTLKIMPEMPTFETEVLPLQQVFANLISNAIKHNDKSQGEVVISVKDLGKAYEFAVMDNGPGISPDYHDKIFVMFQTLQPRDEVENTGVGLAIVKKIIEDKGGNIHIESAEEQGTTIYFTWLK